jgi:type IV pilus assembly protein PilB
MLHSNKVRRLLLKGDLVTEEQWEQAQGEGRDAVQTLIEQGVLTEEGIAETICGAAGIAPINLGQIVPDPEALASISEAECKRSRVLPLTKNADVLTLAVTDPFDVLLFDDIRRETGCYVRTVYANATALSAALDAAFDQGAKQVAEMMEEVSVVEDVHIEEYEEETQDIAQEGGEESEAPAVKLVNLILLRALKAKASDIHIEPGQRSVGVRYRIDGRMRAIMSPPKAILPSLTSRLKILANLDISERQVPQDGKFQVRYEGRSIDCRLSVLPVVGGEKCVIRILDAGSMALSLESMGYEPKCLADIRAAIESPYGMLLVTGPTGSGKSTTLYSCVQAVACEEVNVTTVEDPVEYQMDGINQVPVNPKRGLTFAGALRSILRQDPDVVLLGEIRDKETADIAVKAALTGHLVLSTLHTNDAPGTVSRLADMGVDPFMVSSSLLCVCAQRLGRRLCTHCRKPIERPSLERLVGWGLHSSDLQDEHTFYEADPAGCRQCTQGYRGRFPIFETMNVTPAIKRLIIEGVSKADLKAQAIDEGMLTLRRVGMLNAARGMTSIEEILRVTLGD